MEYIIDNQCIVIIDSLIAIGTLLAAISAWKAASQTKSGIVTQIYSSMNRQYATEEFYDSIVTLTEFYKSNPENFINIFDNMEESSEMYRKITLARRNFKFYFFELWRLWKKNVLKDEDVKNLAHVGNIAVLIKVVWPLELKISKYQPNKQIYNDYRILFPDYINYDIVNQKLLSINISSIVEKSTYSLKPLNYIIVQIKALICMFNNKFFLEQLIEIDYQKELQSNEQLAASDDFKKQKYREKLHGLTILRANLLRKRLLLSSIWIISAALLVIILLIFVCGIKISDKFNYSNIVALISIISFAIATLGRLGWKGQSWVGNTVFENLDKFIFWLLYWIGTLFGALSIFSRI